MSFCVPPLIIISVKLPSPQTYWNAKNGLQLITGGLIDGYTVQLIETRADQRRECRRRQRGIGVDVEIKELRRNDKIKECLEPLGLVEWMGAVAVAGGGWREEPKIL